MQFFQFSDILEEQGRRYTRPSFWTIYTGPNPAFVAGLVAPMGIVPQPVVVPSIEGLYFLKARPVSPARSVTGPRRILHGLERAAEAGTARSTYLE